MPIIESPCNRQVKHLLSRVSLCNNRSVKLYLARAWVNRSLKQQCSHILLVNTLMYIIHQYSFFRHHFQPSFSGLLILHIHHRWVPTANGSFTFKTNCQPQNYIAALSYFKWKIPVSYRCALRLIVEEDHAHLWICMQHYYLQWIFPNFPCWVWIPTTYKYLIYAKIYKQVFIVSLHQNNSQRQYTYIEPSHIILHNIFYKKLSLPHYKYTHKRNRLMFRGVLGTVAFQQALEKLTRSTNRLITNATRCVHQVHMQNMQLFPVIV